MTTVAVITSIHPPTEAVRLFADRFAGRLKVVGDRKSPASWECGEAHFLSVADQQATGFRSVDRIPYNHYGRKMVGYLVGMREGATVLYDTDDDNLPYDDWAIPAFDDAYALTPDNLGWVNVYRSFTDQHIWPRGFDLMRIQDPAAALAEDRLELRPVRVGIWQGLADGDPDVDAIYRLTINQLCTFTKRPPIVLGTGTICPFNSQNTAFRAELFPLLYLPSYVTFRYTDILRGYVAQAIAWGQGFHLGFTRATVYQDRNPHHLLHDFEQEIPFYLGATAAFDVIGAAVQPNASVESNLVTVYAALHQAGIVPDQELALLDAWLEDVETTRRGG